MTTDPGLMVPVTRLHADGDHHILTFDDLGNPFCGVHLSFICSTHSITGPNFPDI